MTVAKSYHVFLPYSNNYIVTVISKVIFNTNKLCGRPPQYDPGACKLTFDLESGVRVACDVGYFCANFSLPRPLCSQLRTDVHDRRMSDAHHHLMHPTPGAGA